jgi:hypothetical protein
VAVERWMRASIVAAALLATAIALLLSAGSATAQGLGLSLPGVGISLPSVGVTVPTVGVTVPSVGVTLPGISVSTPEVSVATPEVTVSTPQVTVSTPSSPSSGSSETPSGSAPTGGGSTGGSSGGSSGGGSSGGETSGGSSSGTGSGSSGEPPSSTSNGSPNATAASVSDSAGARTSSPTPAALATRRRAAGVAAGKRSPARIRHAPLKDRGSGAVPGATGEAGATALDLASSRATRTSPAAVRKASKPASNPLDAIGRRIPLPLPVPDWSKPIIILLALLAIGLALRSRTAVRRARRLERQRVTLLRDVGAMQAALVPDVPARVGGLGVSVGYRPAEGPAAGGDFYDVFVPERGKVAIILGDVAGHGHQALTQAALTRYTLRAYLQAGLAPRAALALAGRVLADPEAERFATVALAVYDTREGQLTYASAGHPAPLIQGPQMRAPIELCASPPIGWTVPTGRRQTTVSLAPGAVVCFFSDGLIEARCKDDLLGRERLGELLAGLGPRPDASKLLARVRKTALATPDDMAACILAPELAIVGMRTHVEELEVEARALATGKVQQFLEACKLPLAEIEPTIECAGEIVAIWGSALLSVELEGEHASAAVSVPSLEPRVAMPEGRPQPAGDPSGQL